MIDKELIELINYEIDGIITPKEKSRLQAYLVKNPEAKKLYQELQTTNSLVNSLPEIETSENLKKRVINAIDFSKYGKGTEESRFHVTKVKWLSAVRIKPAYAFVFGMIFTAIVMIPFVFSDLDNSSTTHKEYWGTTGIEQLNQLHTIEQIPISQGQISGVVDIKTDGNLFFLEPDLIFDQQTSLRIVYNPAQLQLADIKPTIVTQKIALGNSSIRISGAKNIQSLLIFTSLNRASTEIRLEIIHDGKTSFQRTIVLNPEPVTE